MSMGNPAGIHAYCRSIIACEEARQVSVSLASRLRKIRPRTDILAAVNLRASRKIRKRATSCASSTKVALEVTMESETKPAFVPRRARYTKQASSAQRTRNVLLLLWMRFVPSRKLPFIRSPSCFQRHLQERRRF